MSGSDILLVIGMLVALAGMLCSLWRMRRAQSRADLVVAIEVMTFQMICLMVGVALLEDNRSFLDVVLVVSLVGFLTTVILSQSFLMRSDVQQDEGKGGEHGVDK